MVGIGAWPANLLTFGGAGWTFYETLGGGQGASSRGPGPSAVHVGMSNTRNTPIESLEWSLPLRIDEYAIRRKTGGEGAARGGDGVVRRYRVLERCTVTLLTERRRRTPRGAAGGAAGALGALVGGDRSAAEEVRAGAPKARDDDAAEMAFLRRWGWIAPFAWLRRRVLRRLRTIPAFRDRIFFRFFFCGYS